MNKNCTKKSVFFVVFFSLYIILSTDLIFAKEIKLGGKAGWPDLKYQENTIKGKGRFGYDSIEIAPNSFNFDDYSDLLIDFENENHPLVEGDYYIVKNSLQLSTNTKFEKQAGLSRNLGSLSIKGKPGTFFGSQGLMGSFAIEFWLCPSISENGENIFTWETSKTVDDRLVYQMIDASFKDGHIEWNLTNLFDIYMDQISNPKNINDIVLKGSTNIVPDQWSYHSLSYDCESGILEYLVNGITEDLVYITSTGTEDGQTFLVFLGTPSEVHFCKEYTGLIDDIRILRRPYSAPDFQSAENAGKLGHTMYVPTGARFETMPIMLSTGSKINKIEAITDIPPQTEICLYVRSGDNFYGWTDEYPEWKPIENGEDLNDVKGLYCQVAVELFADGGGNHTPSITELTIDYTELPLPLPPFSVKAVAGNEKVTVSWSYSVDDTVGGYYLYYGTRPGEYLGRVAFEGESPINVGNTTSYTLTGLQNGKIYYFAIAAWSEYDDRVIGNFSKEVFARPLERLK